jgi:plastocyanin
VTISIANFAFMPQKLVVKPGTTVTWVNNDTVAHTVTSVTAWSSTSTPRSGRFDSGTINPGASFSYTFPAGVSGTFLYQCAVHVSIPQMHAEVIVSSKMQTGAASTPMPKASASKAGGSTGGLHY